MQKFIASTDLWYMSCRSCFVDEGRLLFPLQGPMHAMHSVFFSHFLRRQKKRSLRWVRFRTIPSTSLLQSDTDSKSPGVSAGIMLSPVKCGRGVKHIICEDEYFPAKIAIFLWICYYDEDLKTAMPSLDTRIHEFYRHNQALVTSIVYAIDAAIGCENICAKS